MPCPVCHALASNAPSDLVVKLAQSHAVSKPVNLIMCWHVSSLHDHEHPHIVIVCNVISSRKVCKKGVRNVWLACTVTLLLDRTSRQ